MIGNLSLALEILRTGDLVGEYGTHQILGRHAHKLWRDLLAATEARQRKRDPANPSPTRCAHWGVKQRLDQQVLHAGGTEVAGNGSMFEAMRSGQLEDNVVLRCRRLQLEIELATETFAQRESPSAIDAAAIGRVDHELHAPRLIEEALEDDSGLRWQAPKSAMRGPQIVANLLRRVLGDTEILDQPAQCFPLIAGEPCFDFASEARDRLRKLIAAGRGLAQPEGNCRRRAMGVLHTHHTAFHTDDAIGGVTKLENIAGETLNGEILVHGTDDVIFRLKQDLEIGVVRNGPARGDCGEPRAASAAKHAIDFVTVNQSATAAPACVETVCQHTQHCRKLLTSQRSIVPRTTHQRKEFVDAPLLGVHFGGDLLGEYVKGLIWHDQAIELTSTDAVEQGGAFDEVITRQWE